VFYCIKLLFPAKPAGLASGGPCPEAGREDSGVAVGEPRVGDLDLFFAVTRTGRSLRRLGRLFLRECILLHSFLGNGVERVAH